MPLNFLQYSPRTPSFTARANASNNTLSGFPIFIKDTGVLPGTSPSVQTPRPNERNPLNVKAFLSTFPSFLNHG